MDSKKPEKLILYSFWRSSASWRVRIALNIKKLDFEYKSIHLVKDGGEQRKEDYEKINPMKFVPALDVDGEILTESMPICEYLDEVITENKLIPTDPIKRARVRAFCENINAGIQPLINLKVRQKVTEIGYDMTEWNKQFIEQGFDSLEKQAAKTKGKYTFGDELTLADVFLVPMVGSSGRWKVDMDKYPSLKAIVAELKKLPEFEKAEPQKQPDAE